VLPNRKVSEIATGRWPAILMHFGIEERFLKNKHGECPICGGKDRYRFDDKLGRGSWICNQCGAGDGFALLERFKGWTFKEAAFQVEQVAGSVQSVAIKQESDEAKKMAAVKRIWNETETVSKGDPVWLYLNRRVGLELIPACLRYHPALPYIEGESVDYFPAMVALVSSHEKQGVGIHRIYLTAGGEKAPVEKSKKLMAGKPLNGSSIKLCASGESLGIAEGIETALAASRKFSVPVWAAISANLLEQWMPPDGVNKVIVFGDNDASFTGQASAYALAKKLRIKGIYAEVRIPEQTGKDWADA